MPTNVDTALSGNTELTDSALSATSAPAAAAGAITFNAIADDASISASGTASFYRTFTSGGATPVTQGSVATSGGSMTLSDLALVAGNVFAIASWVHTV